MDADIEAYRYNRVSLKAVHRNALNSACALLQYGKE